MWIITAGGMFVSGLLCTWIALQYLLQLDIPNRVQTAPPTPPPEEDEPKLTRLGRPIEVKRLQ